MGEIDESEFMHYTLTNNNRVDFTAYAPMHKFKGWALRGLKGSMEVDLETLKLEHVEAALETSFLDTGDTGKNRAMKDYFSLESHPEMSFALTKCREICRLDNCNCRVLVLGVLELAGIRRQLPITCVARMDDEMILVDLQFKWSFKAYGLKAPKLLFLMVRDIVDINAHLEFTPTTKEKQNHD